MEMHKMSLYIVLVSPSLCSTLSLQQGELEMRKKRASRCQHLRGSWVGVSAAQTPVFSQVEAWGEVEGRGWAQGKAIGREFRLKETLRCRDRHSCMGAVAGCPAAVILQTGAERDPGAAQEHGAHGGLVAGAGGTAGCTDVIVADKTRFSK